MYNLAMSLLSKITYYLYLRTIPTSDIYTNSLTTWPSLDNNCDMQAGSWGCDWATGFAKEMLKSHKWERDWIWQSNRESQKKVKIQSDGRRTNASAAWSRTWKCTRETYKRRESTSRDSEASCRANEASWNQLWRYAKIKDIVWEWRCASTSHQVLQRNDC